MENRKGHWETVYGTKPKEKLSWTQEEPNPSLQWILDAVPNHEAEIIDVGGGNSALTSRLLQEGYRRLATLDISAAALAQGKAYLGERQSLIDWIEADVTSFNSTRLYDLWHDRAVFHFLTEPNDRNKYMESLNKALRPGGKVILATFSPTGPSQCSGLSVMRYDEDGLASEVGSGFKKLKCERHTHLTPWGASQDFLYCLFQRL